MCSNEKNYFFAQELFDLILKQEDGKILLETKVCSSDEISSQLNKFDKEKIIYENSKYNESDCYFNTNNKNIIFYYLNKIYQNLILIKIAI